MKRSVNLLHHGFLCSRLLFSRLFSVVLIMVPYAVHAMRGGKPQSANQDAVVLASSGVETAAPQSAQHQVQPIQGANVDATHSHYLALLAQQQPYFPGLGQMPGFSPVFNFTVNATQKSEQVTEQLQRMMAEQQQQQRHEVTIEQVQSQVADLEQTTHQFQRATQEQKAELMMLQATVSQMQNDMHQSQGQEVSIEVDIQQPTSDVFEQFLSTHKWKLGVGLWFITYSGLYKKLTHCEGVSQKPGRYTVFKHAVYANFVRVYREFRVTIRKLFYKKQIKRRRLVRCKKI